MRQLSGADATFLYSDTARANSNVTLIQIYDQSTVAGGELRFKSILAHIEGRLDRSPIFRQKLHRVPLELDYPYWIEDEDFDLEYHVRHIALPKPGDWRQFCIQASRIHARPLDLNRPLWEIYVIEGLDGLLDLPAGSFAMLTKIHHAAIDVEHGAEITTLLHDTTATPSAPTPPAPWFPEGPPGAVSTMLRGVVNSVASSFALAAPLVRALAQVAPAAFSLAGDMLLRPERLAATRFNSIVSPHRVFETRRFMLDEFRAIRRLVPGSTVNDVVLAICGGGPRALPRGRRRVARRQPDGDRTLLHPRGQRVAPRARRRLSWVRVRLCTDVADPVQRLAQIHEQTASSDTVTQAIGARELTDVGRHAPAATLALASKMLGSAASGIGRRTPLANCTITNVPGPSVPLYLCGARMTYFSAIMPIADGMGLVFAVTSYDGRIVMSPTSCRELMPDPAQFAQCLRDSFQEYLALVPASRPPSARVRPRRAAARPPSARARATGALTSGPTRGSSSGTAPPAGPRARRAASAPPSAPAGRPRSRGRSR